MAKAVFVPAAFEWLRRLNAFGVYRFHATLFLSFWVSCATYSSKFQVTISNHLKPPQTISNIINNLKPPQTISNYFKPSQTISNHFKPFQMPIGF